MRRRACWRHSMMAIMLPGLCVFWPGVSGAESQTNDPTGSPPPVEETSHSLLGDNVSVQAGYKVWLNKWSTRTEITTTGGSNNQTSHFGPMQGPQATVTLFNRVFATFQYLDNGYKFNDAGTFHQNVSGNRADTTVIGGVRVWRGFGLFAGYYHTLQRFSNFSQDPANLLNRTALRARGPIIGLFGTAQIEDSPFALYGNLGTGWLRTSTESETSGKDPDRFNARAYSVEFGFNYAGPTIGYVSLSAQVGFRAQVIEYDTKAGSANVPARANDVLYGPTFMVSARF